MKPKAAIRQGISVKYQCRIIDAKTGIMVRELPRKSNLVMDSGLNEFATLAFVDLFADAIVGTGTNPVMRYSSPVTFTQSGNQVTASAPFFASSDVGYILKYGAQGAGSGGAEQYITAFTSNVLVTVGSSAIVPSTLGAVWYVTQTSMQAPVKSTSSYASSGNGSLFATGSGTCSLTHTRIFNFSVETGTVTYNEVGWSWNEQIYLGGI